MPRVLVPQCVYTQEMLAVRGLHPEEPLSEAAIEYLRAFQKTRDALKWSQPGAGERQLIDGVEAYTIHVRHELASACHYFVYRHVGDEVEVGALLHDSMPLNLHLPLQWRAEAGQQKRRAV